MKIAQVIFRDEWGNACAGIRLDDGRILCGCCGGIYEPEGTTIVKVFNNWEDISNAIAEVDNLEDISNAIAEVDNLEDYDIE